MRISTKGRYGLRVLLDVALHEDAGAVSLSDISRRQSISKKYLWQVVNPLKATGILRATRGTQGGYYLARDPASISLYDIVNVLETSGSLVECLATPDSCERSEACITREAWLQVAAKMDAALKEITLEHLITRHKTREHEIAPSYMI